MISITAILNKNGSGELCFGVKDNGDVIGQEVRSAMKLDVKLDSRSRRTAL